MRASSALLPSILLLATYLLSSFSNSSASMVSIGRGIRSVQFKHHAALLRRRVQEQEKLLVVLAVCLADDDDVVDVLASRRKKQRRLFKKPKVADLFDRLGSMARRSYRMTYDSFVKLYKKVQKNLQDTFIPEGGHRNDEWNISLSLRLSCALRYFSGGAVADLIITHGFSHGEVYKSVWGCVDSVNKCKDLDFPGFSHVQQKKYAEGFKSKSAAGFDKVIASVDGMLV